VTKPANPEKGVYVGKFVIRNCDGILLSKMIRAHNDIMVTDASAQQIPVISMVQHATVFGAHKLHPNFVCVTPASTAPVPAPVPKKKAPKPASVHSGGLPLYVAKQLFDLAVIRNEQCPIVAEEFSAGNTAVMPCGHLFMQVAIEESFKSEPNKCPWCRQAGMPTFL